jgi:tetratricopeptide (TPR) repeat protein
MRLSAEERRRLQRDLSQLLGRPVRSADLLTTLEHLARTATDVAAASFAAGCLAELLADSDPWAASLHAKRLLARDPEDARAWAALALAQVHLGNFRYAARCYAEAATRDEANPWYVHNLGHLTDVALNAPEEALPYLARAVSLAPDKIDLIASYAHALGRCGKLEEAQSLLGEMAQQENARRPKKPLAVPSIVHPVPVPLPRPQVASQAADVPIPKRAPRSSARSRSALETALASLPFSLRQRQNALRLLADAHAALRDGERRPGPRQLAAAVAWAIAEIDGIPLACVDVASTFRLPTADLRRAHDEVASALALLPEDLRYGSRRVNGMKSGPAARTMSRPADRSRDNSPRR